MAEHLASVAEIEQDLRAGRASVERGAARVEADADVAIDDAKSSEALGYAIGIAAWAIGGTVFVAVKVVQDEMPPWTMACARVLLTTLVLSVFLIPHRKSVGTFLRRHGAKALAVGAIGLGINQGLLFSGLHLTSAINVGIIFALSPIFTLVLARIVLGEAMSPFQALGALIAFLGVATVTVQGDPERLARLQIGLGELFAFGASICFAIYTVLLRQAKFDLPRVPLLSVLLCGGVLGSAPFAVWEYVQGEHEHLGRNGYLALLYCAVVGGGLLYLFFNWSVEILGAGRAGSLIYTQPLFVALFAWLILGERLEWYHYLGGAIVALGVVLVLTTRPKPRPVHGP